MITAIVLIKTSVDRIPEIAESIAALDSVSEVYSVTGTYDLIALVRVARHENLADIIPGRISKIPGV
ncbi:Lrp/AsnC family transcriptional regulator, partial [Streptomyces sp. NPDC058612]